MRMVRIARAFSPFDAHLIVAMLADAGIIAHPVWIGTLGADWPKMLACGGISIEVPKDDVESAAAILADVEPPTPFRPVVPLLLMPFAVIVLMVIGVPLPLRLPAEMERVELTA